jgi:pyruvate decarboxylase
MGKSTIPESLPSFLGLYAGAGTPHPHIRELVESSDLVLSIGAVQSDFNTAGFSYSISQLKTIDFHSTFVAVGYAKFEGVRMNGVLSKMAERVELDRLSNEGSLERLPPLRHVKSDEVKSGYQSVRVDSSTSIIKHEYLWTRLSTFLRPDDIVITETGTSNFGIWETTFPDGVIAISQILWGSIGYATAACQGAALAAVEEMREGGGGKKRRTILLTGEGSLQLTAQELSTMVSVHYSPTESSMIQSC